MNFNIQIPIYDIMNLCASIFGGKINKGEDCERVLGYLEHQGSLLHQLMSLISISKMGDSQDRLAETVKAQSLVGAAHAFLAATQEINDTKKPAKRGRKKSEDVDTLLDSEKELA